MKDNTTKSKELLEQALRLLPRDFALSNARAYLNRAINEVKSVETKRIKRNEVLKTEEKKTFEPIHMSPQQQKTALDQLDKLIEAEENKLKALRNKKNETTAVPTKKTRPDQTLNG